MQSKILIVIVLAAFLLGACQPANTATPGEAVQEPELTTAPAADQQAAISTTAPEVEAATAEPLALAGEPMSGCRVTGSQLEPDPTLVALFPAVNEQDWVIGPSDAQVTILEFSDFQ